MKITSAQQAKNY